MDEDTDLKSAGRNCLGGSIPSSSAVNKVGCPSGLGDGLQNYLREFESHPDLWCYKNILEINGKILAIVWKMFYICTVLKKRSYWLMV